MLEPLINGRYSVNLSKPLPGAGGGMPAFAASDGEGVCGELMAVQLRPGDAVRAQAITALAANPPAGMLLPLAQGPLAGTSGTERYFLICQAPPGPALASFAPKLPDAELLATVLQPAATALEALRVRKVTHRAIRPDNLFRGEPGSSVVLGCAWVGPPAALQPAMFEPPYIAACHPASRGEGLIADDVYALGVTLLSLALGRVPLAGRGDDEVLLRKLERGSFDALAGHERLSPMLADVIRGMLAEHPEHRSPPALLSAAAVGARRVASRPAPPSAKPLSRFATPVSNPRTLAFAIARQPKQGVELIRSGEIDRWLRRGIGEAMLANRIQDAQRSAAGAAAEELQRADAVLAMRAVAVLDPLAPLCWRGLMLWPDGMGGVLAGEEERELPAVVEEIVSQDVVASWEAVRSRRDGAAGRIDAASLRGWLQSSGVAGGAARLLYALAPGTRCRSRLLSAHWVTDGRELLLALDGLGRQEPPAEGPMDRDVAAFVAALAHRDGDRELSRLADSLPAAPSALLQLRALALLQTRCGVPAVPGIAAWLARGGELASQGWRHRGRRRAMEERLAGLIEEGRLAGMLAVIDNPVERARDMRDARDAEQQLRRIDEEISLLGLQAPRSDGRGHRTGHEIAAAMGIVAAGAAALMAGVL